MYRSSFCHHCQWYITRPITSQRKRPHWRSSESQSQLQRSSGLTAMPKSYGSHPCWIQDSKNCRYHGLWSSQQFWPPWRPFSLCQKYCAGIVQRGMFRTNLAALLRSCINPSSQEYHSNLFTYFKHTLHIVTSVVGRSLGSNISQKQMAQSWAWNSPFLSTWKRFIKLQCEANPLCFRFAFAALRSTNCQYKSCLAVPALMLLTVPVYVRLVPLQAPLYAASPLGSLVLFLNAWSQKKRNKK